MIKRTLMVATALLLLWAAPASAQYEPPFTGNVSNPNPNPGETITVEGSCNVGDAVEVFLDGPLTGGARARATPPASNPDAVHLGTIPVEDGTYSGTVTIPVGTAAGDYALVLTCGGEVLSLNITVGSAPDGPGGPDLADTGTGGIDSLLKVAAALLALGAATLLVVGKRRRGATAA